jgi:raffinose/stachyose/melibiose transport system permease protein
MHMTKRSNYIKAALFILPAFALMTVFLIYPIFDSVILSFYHWRGISSAAYKFVGLANYKDLFTNKYFYISLKNVGWFLLVGLTVQMWLSVTLALIISNELKGTRFFKTAFFTPVVLPLTAVGLMWSFILYPNGGPLNLMLESLGLKMLARNWLGETATVSVTVALVNMWVWAGFNMLIFAAGMTNIPEELYEAAKIDGADGLTKFFYVTVPLLKESFKVYILLCITGCLRVFDIVFVMTGGGPNGASDMPGTLLYYQAFRYENFGLASSIGTFILVTGLIASAFLNWFANRSEKIEGRYGS